MRPKLFAGRNSHQITGAGMKNSYHATKVRGMRSSLCTWLLAAAALASDSDRIAGEAHLAANAQADGVIVKPSGLQYKILASGSATGDSPGSNSPCVCHYKGTLVDGTEVNLSGPSSRSPDHMLALYLQHPY